MSDYIPGDHVEIIAGDWHANFGRKATVSSVQGGDLVVRFGDRDEDEWIYSPWEVRKIK